MHIRSNCSQHSTHRKLTQSFTVISLRINELAAQVALLRHAWLPGYVDHHHHYHHLSFNREGRLGTTDDFATSFLHFSLFSTALLDLANSRPVHSLMLSSHRFLCLPCLLLPCKMVLARPDERETWPYHCSLRLFKMVRRSSCDPIACWILTRTSSLVTWSLYEMRIILL